MFPKSKSYQHILKGSFTKLGSSVYSTNIYKRNYFLSTSSTSITQTLKPFSLTSRIIKEFSFIFPYIIKRSIASLDTPKEIEQAEQWLKKFTKEKIPRGKNY